jgi:2-polyprenyl-3-methyl-5-hydroxy-6-metoxy-1,4-benzoquinol methylase
MTDIRGCIACGQTDLQYHFTGRDKNITGHGHFRYSRCRQCGLIFINPRPGEASLAEYYPTDRYFSFRKIDTTSASTRMRRFLYRLFFHVKNDRPFLREILWLMQIFSRGAFIIPGTRLLDIGCGSGQFLHEMAQFGVNACGIDPYYRQHNDAAGPLVTVFTGKLTETGFHKESFDSITMNHVLEHVSDPHPLLDEVHRLLKSRGLFIIAVPNTDSLAFRLFGKNWYQVDTPRHLVLYSSRILKGLLEQHGFSVEKCRYNSNPRQITYSLANLFNVHALRRFSIVLDVLLTPLVLILNYLQAGDQFEFFCRKGSK